MSVDTNYVMFMGIDLMDEKYKDFDNYPYIQRFSEGEYVDYGELESDLIKKGFNNLVVIEDEYGKWKYLASIIIKCQKYDTGSEIRNIFSGEMEAAKNKILYSPFTMLVKDPNDVKLFAGLYYT
jgi:hypothetical protein